MTSLPRARSCGTKTSASEPIGKLPAVDVAWRLWADPSAGYVGIVNLVVDP